MGTVTQSITYGMGHRMTQHPTSVVGEGGTFGVAIINEVGGGETD